VRLVVGTRPEAIKLAPVARALAARGVRPSLILTGQHSLDPAEFDLGTYPATRLHCPGLEDPHSHVRSVTAAVKAHPDCVPSPDHAAIEAFLERIWSQDGVADLTLVAYRSDLELCAAWLRARGTSLVNATYENLSRYLGERGKAQIKARSNARLLTVLRRFFADYARTRSDFDDPTLLLDAPKLPRSLPKALSEREIEALIAAPNVDCGENATSR